MKNKFLWLILFIGIISSVSAKKQNIENVLSNLPDVTFTKIENTKGFETTYKLLVKQPLDHDDLSKGFFHQKVYLSHRDFNSPTVFITQGYSISTNRISELTDILGANQINVEHRFFGESLPDSLDYHYLNLKQVAADLHHINQLFRHIYPQSWVSTGVSKGGATTIFYRYFYPNDVALSIPYVAPINRALEDSRIYKFLNTIGTDECREKIRSFQIQLLENRKEVIPVLKEHSEEANAHYTILSFNEAFEYAVMEYPFSFWQYGQSCDEIPNPTASSTEIAKYLSSVSSVTFFSDESIYALTPHFYQSATEMGYYGYETYKFKDYLIELPTDTNPQATFFPFEMNDPFNGSLLKDVHQWLDTNQTSFLYIYGGIDTWTATGVPPSDLKNSQWFILEGKHHGNARIKNMNEADRKRFNSAITTLWLITCE